jgi:hypothetical protein
MHDDDRRYAPPSTPLRDVEAERELSERPAQVRWATALLWLSFTLGAALAVYELRHGSSAELAPAVDAVLLGFTVGALAFSALLNVMIFKGHNWARIVYLLLAVVAVVLLLMPSEEGQALTLTETIGYALSSLLDFAAMVLVFTRPGALWFQRRRFKTAAA